MNRKNNIPYQPTGFEQLWIARRARREPWWIPFLVAALAAALTFLI